MEKFRPKIEAELFIPEGWYYNDDFVSDVYMKLETGELSEATTKHLFYEVEDELGQLLAIDKDKLTAEQLNNITILSNIAKEIYKHIPHSHQASNISKDGIIDLGNTIN